MADNGNQNEQEKEVLDQLIKEQGATKAIQKLNRTSHSVSAYRHTSLVQEIELRLGQLDERLKDTKDSETEASLKAEVKELEERLALEDKDKIEGVLTPLSWRDINNIKAFITEAVLDFNEFNFDPAVKIARMIAEERYATVFLCLKKKDNPKVRYFDTLEDVAVIEEETINDIYSTWEKYFVVTEDELKN